MKAMPAELDSTDDKRRFYRAVLDALDEKSGLSYLVGGTHALEQYTGALRITKDLDLFIRPGDVAAVLEFLGQRGFPTEMSFSHWLAKVFSGNDFIDIIFSSGNGVCAVDDEWFEHAHSGELLGLKARFCPAEELIWSKTFVMERERYDGADIAHIIRSYGSRLDWPRLLRRFEVHWQVLLSHVILFDFIYPSERSMIPPAVRHELLQRLDFDKGTPPPRNRICRGTLLSRSQYRADVEDWGYQDARQTPLGSMSPQQTAAWGAAAADSSR